MNNYKEFKEEFDKLGDNLKTSQIDKFNKELIRNKTDVSFLRNYVFSDKKYSRTYFQVSLSQRDNYIDQLNFIENNFDLLNSWWEVDQLEQFIDKNLPFEYAFKKSKIYTSDEREFVKRFGYVVFIPRLVKDENSPRLFELLKNDEKYYVIMAQAWLISFLAIYHYKETLLYLSKCNLDYKIISKAISKICDSKVIPDYEKDEFKKIRQVRKNQI